MKIITVSSLIVVRHCHATHCVDFPVCVAAENLTLRMGRDMGAHCAPLRKKESPAGQAGYVRFVSENLTNGDHSAKRDYASKV